MKPELARENQTEGYERPPWHTRACGDDSSIGRGRNQNGRPLSGLSVQGERYPSPSLYATNYYNATIAALTALEAIGGELDVDQANFRAALSQVVLEAPNGTIRLDENRQAIGPTFITEVAEGTDGELYNRFVAKRDDVTQTLGMTVEEFRSLGLPGRDTPDCAAL